jgi:hypothetical protein
MSRSCNPPHMSLSKIRAKLTEPLRTYRRSGRTRRAPRAVKRCFRYMKSFPSQQWTTQNFTRCSPYLTPCESARLERVVHSFSNPHSATVRALIMNTPDIGAQYFREVGAIINAAGPPDRNRLVETMRMFGLVPAAAQRAP